MKKAFGATLSAVILATSVVGTSAVAAPRHNYQQQDEFIQNYCGRHHDNDCNDWRDNRDRWDEARYHRWYRSHRHDHDFGPVGAAAALFGFAAGTAAGIVTGTVNGAVNSDHVAACEDRYRSYDPATDTYMGHDGYRHECRM